jgi:hypothetical protein
LLEKQSDPAFSMTPKKPGFLISVSSKLLDSRARETGEMAG